MRVRVSPSLPSFADVAEMEDALGSNPSVFLDVPVRSRPSAPSSGIHCVAKDGKRVSRSNIDLAGSSPVIVSTGKVLERGQDGNATAC